MAGYIGSKTVSLSTTAANVEGNITVTGNVDGRDVSVDGTKLDGIETAATADQTDAEIRTAVESATNSNVFTDADHTKLDGIEASATADQTDAEIKTAVQNSSDIALAGNPTTTTQSPSNNSTRVATTAYTDAAITALVNSAPVTLDTLNELAAALDDDPNYAATTATLIGSKMPKSGGAFTGAVTTNSTFDGVDIAARDAVLTSTTTVANAALPKSGGTVTGDVTFNTQLGLGVAPHATASLNITNTNQHIRLNNGSELGVISLLSSGELELWGHGDSESINFRTGAGTGNIAMNIVGNNVGIGTSSPTRQLDVSNAGAAYIRASDTSNSVNMEMLAASSGGWIGTQTNHSLNFQTNNTERMRIDSSGNVGIGVSNVASRLSIANPSDDGTIDYTKGITFADSLSGSSEAWVHAGIVTTGSTGFNGNLIFATDGTGSKTLDTSGLTERMRISSAGNVGIGTSSPSGQLELERASNANYTGTFGFEGAALQISDDSNTVTYPTASAQMQFKVGTTGVAESYIAGLRESANRSSLAFGTQAGATRAERMRIDSSGNVGIGTTPSAKIDASGTYRMQLRTDDAVPELRSITANGAAFKGLGLNGLDLRFFTSSTERMRIDSSGNLLLGETAQVNAGFQVNKFNGTSHNGIILKTTRSATGTTFIGFVNSAGTFCGNINQDGATTVALTTSSDQRLKENIADSDDSGSTIDAIKVRKFDWIDGGVHEKYGFIAQELKTVVPEAVSSLGLPDEDDPMLGVNQSKLIALAIKEIQLLRVRVAELETKVTALEG